MVSNNKYNFLIVTGPTIEKIDPVRYISNYSSGKMGLALSQAALECGEKVFVVSGPVNISYDDRCEVEMVESAEEMFSCSFSLLDKVDIIIVCAAICDFKPINYQTSKIKKSSNSDTFVLTLKQNPDILKTLASHRKNNQVFVGFAAETNNLLHYAKKKLDDKQCDMIVANEVGNNKTFGQDASKAYLVTNSEIDNLGYKPKYEHAIRIINYAIKLADIRSQEII